MIDQVVTESDLRTSAKLEADLSSPKIVQQGKKEGNRHQTREQ
ncbi:predicted protein [Botrytis cinerea T4]|uniref:Uncharacterized protein n=1 Tax=Botryotinia fuckeliana (strain T4) TaxID=999810 RepID=G2YMK3_BOTF4|nr:predicted protein [Botrytis cinerea T4]